MAAPALRSRRPPSSRRPRAAGGKVAGEAADFGVALQHRGADAAPAELVSRGKSAEAAADRRDVGRGDAVVRLLIDANFPFPEACGGDVLAEVLAGADAGDGVVGKFSQSDAPLG